MWMKEVLVLHGLHFCRSKTEFWKIAENCMKPIHKQILTIVTFFIVLNISLFAQQSWEPESRQADKIIYSQSNTITKNLSTEIWSPLGPRGIAAPDLTLDPLNSNKIIVAGMAGMFITTNGGQNWNIASTSSYNVKVNRVKFHPTNNNIILAICEDNITGSQYIVRSSNGGSSWSMVKSIIDFNSYGKIVFTKSNPNTVYIAGYYVLKSTDAGATWVEFQNLSNVGDFDVFDQDPNKLYATVQTATTSLYSFYSSSDGGISWTNIAKTPFYINCIKISPTNFSLIYAGSSDLTASSGYGFLKSTDGGSNWTSASTGGGIISVMYDITLHPDNPNIIYANGGGSGLMKSTNAGSTWTNIMSSLNDNYVYRIQFDTQNNLYVSTGGNIYKTTNEIDYQTISGDLANTGVFQICVHPTNPGIVYVSTLGGVLKSIDGGKNWNHKSKGIYDTDNYSLGINPQSANTIFAGSLRGFVYRTTDGGDNWVEKTSGLPPSDLSRNAVRDFLFHPLNVNTVYTSMASGKTFISTNSGDSWVEYKVNNNTESIRFLDISTSSRNVWYAYNVTGGKLYRSSDYGVTWSPKKSALSLYSIFLDANTPDILYADQLSNSTHNISKSSDGGVTWNIVYPNMNITDIYSLPGNQNILFASTMNSGVLKSTDGGSTWVQMNSGLPYLTCNMVRSLAGTTNSFFVATYGGSVFAYNYTPTGIREEVEVLPNEYILCDNYPNPFNPSTKIKIGLHKNVFTQLTIYDALGREVKKLISDKLNSGYHEVEFNASGLTSGMYFYSLQAGDFTQTKKMILLK
jgi:photosystem II stability/assembly factor-like uncharacterized protein